MDPAKKKNSPLTASFVTGAIALVFLILGYQVALFIHKAAVTRLVANRDSPDTVYVIDPALAKRLLAEDMADHDPFVANERADAPQGSRSADASFGSRMAGDKPFVAKKKADAPQGLSPADAPVVLRRGAEHGKEAVEVREKAAPRRVERFRFNPNTVSVEDLQRLGFSERQAQAIDHYRQKGGRFRRPGDFARSYVVADSVFERLAPYIDIPRLDINRADSVALLDLPGIGPYFAGKVVQYRTLLGGYSCKEQLLEIYHFDKEKYDGLQDLIVCSEPEPFPMWTLPEEQLARHPHISRAEAHGIVLYREHHTPEDCTVEGLYRAGVLSGEHAQGLGRCRIAPLLRQ